MCIVHNLAKTLVWRVWFTNSTLKVTRLCMESHITWSFTPILVPSHTTLYHTPHITSPHHTTHHTIPHTTHHTLHGLPRQFWCPASLPTCQSTNTFPLLFLLNIFYFFLYFMLPFLLEVCMFCALFCFQVNKPSTGAVQSPIASLHLLIACAFALYAATYLLQRFCAANFTRAHLIMISLMHSNAVILGTM